MRTLMILLTSVAVCQAQSTTWAGGSVTTVIACGADDCPRDLVIRTRDDKTVLIRRVIGCEASAMRLKQSSDVLVAECFK